MHTFLVHKNTMRVAKRDLPRITCRNLLYGQKGKHNISIVGGNWERIIGETRSR